MGDTRRRASGPDKPELWQGLGLCKDFATSDVCSDDW